MAEWKSARELVLVVWQDVEAEEEEGEGEGEGEEAGTQRAYAFVFDTEQEAMAFVADEVRDKVKVNEDNLPPSMVRQIYQTLDSGDTIMALNMWLQAAYEYFGEPEAVDMRKVPLMTRA